MTQTGKARKLKNSANSLRLQDMKINFFSELVFFYIKNCSVSETFSLLEEKKSRNQIKGRVLSGQFNTRRRGRESHQPLICNMNFATIVYCFQPLVITVKLLLLDFCGCSGYVSIPVLCSQTKKYQPAKALSSNFAPNFKRIHEN